MLGLVNVVRLRGKSGYAQDNIPDGRFAARIGMPVEQGEQKRHGSTEHRFAGQKNPFPGNETVVENHIRIRGPLGHAAFVMLPRPEIVNGDHLFESVPVTGNGKGNRPVLIIFEQRPRGGDQDLVSHGGFRDMHLASFDHDAVFESFLDPEISARIGLLRGPQHAISFHIRLGAAADQVFLLETCEPFLEVFMVLRFSIIEFIGFIGNIVNRIGCVDPHAALDAAADFLAEHAGHILLSMQVFFILVDMRETVDAFTRQMGNRRHQILVFGFFRFVIG